MSGSLSLLPQAQVSKGTSFTLDRTSTMRASFGLDFVCPIHLHAAKAFNFSLLFL